MRTYKGSASDPVILDPWKRITQVQWTGGAFAVLEITAPASMFFLFGDYSLQGSLAGTFGPDDIIAAVMEIGFEDPILGNLYHLEDFFYYIGTVVFPDRVPPDPFAYETIKAGIHPPNRFVEPVDLRTLSNKEFPYNISGWPTDGNWANPKFVWGTWADGRPGYLPASSGPNPAAPGYYINPNWGLGEAYMTTLATRDEKKYAFLLDFTSREDRIDQGTVELSIQGPAPDPHLPSYSMALNLRMYSPRATFTVAGTTITATLPPATEPLPPRLTQTKSTAYDQTGIIARITRSGFVA